MINTQWSDFNVLDSKDRLKLSLLEKVGALQN